MGRFGERKWCNYNLKAKRKIFKNWTILKGNRKWHNVELQAFCLNNCNKKTLYQKKLIKSYIYLSWIILLKFIFNYVLVYWFEWVYVHISTGAGNFKREALDPWRSRWLWDFKLEYRQLNENIQQEHQDRLTAIYLSRTRWMTTCTKNYKVMNTDTQRYIRLNKCPKKACRIKENIFTNMNIYVISTKNWEDNLFNFMVASKDVNYLGRYLSSKYRTLKNKKRSSKILENT